MTPRQQLILAALACAAGEWEAVGREGGLLEMMSPELAAQYRDDAVKIRAWAEELRSRIARGHVAPLAPDEDRALGVAREARDTQRWEAA